MNRRDRLGDTVPGIFFIVIMFLVAIFVFPLMTIAALNSLLGMGIVISPISYLSAAWFHMLIFFPSLLSRLQ
jgi:hypothetical protein